MLVLSRRKGELLRLYTSDGVIEVRVCESTNSQAKLGITAPSNVKILREEIDPQQFGTSGNRPLPETAEH